MVMVFKAEVINGRQELKRIGDRGKGIGIGEYCKTVKINNCLTSQSINYFRGLPMAPEEHKSPSVLGGLSQSWSPRRPFGL
jgi:hypothetical protein